MKFIILVAFAIFQILGSSRGARIPDNQLRAPVYPKGQKSPEEIGDFHQGDIILTGKLSNGIINQNKRWVNAIVPYEISPVYSQGDVDLIMEAMTTISGGSCIKFVQRTNLHKDYISIRSKIGAGCSSNVGRVGGKQYVNLATFTDGMGNCFDNGYATVAHELLHVLGFEHMQSSYDRDDYVTINSGNILSGKASNFVKLSIQTFAYYGGATYDYASVMHFGRKYFTKNGYDTITTKDPTQQDVIGQRTQLSDGDFLRLKGMYRCPA